MQMSDELKRQLNALSQDVAPELVREHGYSAVLTEAANHVAVW